MGVASPLDAGDPAAPLRLADEAMAAGDVDEAVAHLSAAVRSLTAAGDKRQAAMTCARLGDVFANALGNRVAARPWLTRAMRLVEHEAPCLEQGYAAVAAMGCDVDDPAVLVDRAKLALERARRFGDVDLETKALADGGLAHVQAGRVSKGMAMVDEAMALACGGATSDARIVGQSVCSFFTACYFTADFERVEMWSHLLRQRGYLGPAPGPQAFLSGHCNSVQGTLLCHLGRWSDAEALLTRALAENEEVMPGSAWHPPIALAELRILQGRLAEAEVLLLGRDDHIQALLPTARLYLARGDLALALATARRGLRLMGGDRVRAAALLGVVVEAELGRGDLCGAAEASAELDARTRGLALPALGANAARLRARVGAAQGDVAAAALLARLDVVVTADDAAILRRLGVQATACPTSVGCRLATLEHDGTWWTAACGDTRVRLHATLGLRYLADLVAHPGAERHALDLVDVVEGVPAADAGIDRRRLGDAGELLDAQSRTRYRRRVGELRGEVEDALAAEDDDRAARVQTELDALVAELARAFGLGGRDRKASSAAERARLNVTRALRTALARLTEALPGAGVVLDRRVRTGLFCSYRPHPDDQIVWSVQS